MKKDDCHGGRNSKEWIMALLGCTANGTDRLLLVTGKTVVTSRMSESFVPNTYPTEQHMLHRLQLLFKGIRCKNELPKHKKFYFTWTNMLLVCKAQVT